MVSRSRRGFASGFAVLVMLAANVASALEAGDRAPDFSAPSLDRSGTIELGEFRGKVVYVDFWASWCAPCLVAIPEIEALRRELSNARFQILAINLDQKQSKALRFLSKNPVGYPSLSDPKGRLPEQFGLETMPTSYLIDRDGIIRYVHRGFRRGVGSDALVQDRLGKTTRSAVQPALESSPATSAASAIDTRETI